MVKKEIPLWVIAGGFALAVNAGCINAVGFLGAYHQAVSHMSGPMTTLGIELAGRDDQALRHSLCIIFSFFLGAVVSGSIIRQSVLRIGRRYGVVLAIESVVLFGAVACLRQGLRSGDYLAAIACGLQNGMASSYSGAVIRTTHVTGIVTDLGIGLGHFLRGCAVDWRRLRLYLTILCGFLLGGFLGASGYARLGSATLLVPALFSGLAGLGYAGFKHRERVLERESSRRPGLTGLKTQGQRP